MIITDIKNRIIYVTQNSVQRNRIKNIRGAEPTTRSGKVRLRGGRIKYGIRYNANVIKYFNGRSKILGRNKFWDIKILEIGKSPFLDSIGKAKKQYMGRIKHRIEKHKFQGINQSSWKDLTQSLKRRKK